MKNADLGLPFDYYDVSDVSFVFDVYSVDKRIYEAVNENGITIDFTTYANIEHNYKSMRARVPVHKTFTKALGVMGFSREHADLLDVNDQLLIVANTDLMTSELFNITSQQWRIGNRLMPTHPITDVKSSYVNAQIVFDAYNDDRS